MSQEPGRLHTLIKFGRLEHIRRLHEHGEMHMRCLSFYRNFEGDDHRGDPFEGDTALWQPERLTQLRVGDIQICPSDLTGPLRVSMHSDLNSAVYCMSAVSGRLAQRHLQDGVPLIDPRCGGFGEMALVVRDVAPFFERLREALKRRGFVSEARYVEYVDTSVHSGDYGPFRKDHRFHYQQEWRLVVRNPPAEEFTLALGSLADITIVTDSRRAIDEMEAVEHQAVT